MFPAHHCELSWQLLLWTPVGLVVAPLRMLLWTLLAVADEPSWTDNTASLQFIIHRLLGVETRWEHAERIPAGFHCAVSNHGSLGDFLALYTQERRYTHLIHAGVPPVWPKRHRVSFAHATPLQLKKLRRVQRSGGREGGEEEEALPVHFFPEGILSSSTALLRFSRSFATLQAPVVPVALRSSHALGISTHTLTSSFAANLWWLCFAPWGRLTATVLPPMNRWEGEDAADFAQRVRAALALELGVGMVDVGPEEKALFREKSR